MQNNISKNKYQIIEELAKTYPHFIDLTNAEHSKLILEAAGNLSNIYNDISEIEKIEQELISKNDESLIFILLALKIAKSKIEISNITKPVTVSIVFAVYKEHNRIKKSIEHAHGEDFLRKKVSELEWLFKDLSNFKWELIVVDDGCPENSGKIAQEIVDKEELNDNVKVIFLKDAIKKRLAPAKMMQSTNESQKGGSIAFGMWYAAHYNKQKNHIIAYTDADLSTHLGQLGLLIKPLIYKNKSAAIGSRRESNSIVIKKGTRNNRGKLFIYLWKRLIPNLGDIIDTQCGFKAFKGEVVTNIIDNLIEKKFAFDIELLLKTELIEKNAISKVPIAWIDSEEASTTTDLQPYLTMLKSIVKMYKAYFTSNKNSDEFASFIESLSEDSFNIILNNIPIDITKREPIEFTEYDKVTVDDLKKCMN